MYTSKVSTSKRAEPVEGVKRSKQFRREVASVSHGDFRRSLYEVTIISMGKLQSRGENGQNRAFWLFKAYLRLFDFCFANKKLCGFWVRKGSVMYNPAG
jgi:hypothetical protein